MSAAVTQVEVKDTGMIFQPESVRAIIEGNKTQTRRVIKPQPHKNVARFVRSLARAGWLEEYDNGDPLGIFTGGKPVTWTQTGKPYRCPYGDAGDHVWVREAWMPKNWDSDKEYMLAGCPDAATHPSETYLGSPTRAIYKASYNDAIGDPGKWRNSMYMPRWASRITLEITNVRVERLQEISGRDVLAEGIDNGSSNPAMGVRWENMQRMAFEEQWNNLNAKRGYSWESNPWCWCISFRKL